MDMFQAGNELSFSHKTTHKFGIVSIFGENNFDGNFPINGRLLCAVNSSEAPETDQFSQNITLNNLPGQVVHKNLPAILKKNPFV